MIFVICGHIDNDSRATAERIADNCESVEECWEEVNKLDAVTQNAIYEVGDFEY